MSKLKNNWTAKIFALVIAIFLWSYVMSEVNPIITATKGVDIRLNNIESLDRQGLVVMEPKTATISVKISGPKSDVDAITSANILAEVDLAGYSEGEMKVPVRVKLQDTPYNVKILDWEVRELLFKIDKLISKDISINVETLGEVEEGHILEDINREPQNITIKGPRTWVNEVSEARAVVDLTDRTTSTNESVPIQLLNGKGEEVRGVEKDPGIVELSIDISKTKTLPIELETINKLPENINIKDIQIYPKDIKVKASEGLEELELIKTIAIDINNLIGKTSMEVELALPDGVKLVDPKQKISISYSIEETLGKEYIFSSDEISVRNLNPQYMIKKETIPSKVRVALNGPKSIFDNISKENIKLYIDLKDIGLGKNEIEIKMEDIQGLTLVSTDPKRTEIELEEIETEETPVDEE